MHNCENKIYEEIENTFNIIEIEVLVEGLSCIVLHLEI